MKYINEGTVRGYIRTESGSLEIKNVPVIDGYPVDYLGCRLIPDNETVRLIGWPDSSAQSYDNGHILIAN